MKKEKKIRDDVFPFEPFITKEVKTKRVEQMTKLEALQKEKDESYTNGKLPEKLEALQLELAIIKEKKAVKKADYQQFKLDIDFFLRHELQLGTLQIRKLWARMDKIVLR